MDEMVAQVPHCLGPKHLKPMKIRREWGLRTSLGGMAS